MQLLLSNQDKWDSTQKCRSRFVRTTPNSLPELRNIFCSGSSGANLILRKQELSINIANSVFYTRDSSWNRNSNTNAHDRPLHDGPSSCVISQQYPYANSVWPSRFHFCKEKLDAYFKVLLLVFYFSFFFLISKFGNWLSWNCVIWEASVNESNWLKKHKIRENEM